MKELFPQLKLEEHLNLVSVIPPSDVYVFFSNYALENIDRYLMCLIRDLKITWIVFQCLDSNLLLKGMNLPSKVWAIIRVMIPINASSGGGAEIKGSSGVQLISPLYLALFHHHTSKG